MSVRVERRGVKHPKHRLVEAETGRIARRESGAPLDGGGHNGKAKAVRQAGHINQAPRRDERKKP